jgi:glycosyltransferase involved in cell wall biosynthesis
VTRDLDALRIVLVGDYPADPRLGSAKVLFKLRDEFRALGHTVRLLTREDLGGPAQRHARDLASPWLAARAVDRARTSEPPDVIDASSAEGYALSRRRGGGPQVIVARSHGLEHLNYQRMLEDAREGLAGRAWYRRIWYPAVRLRLVAGAARRADRLIVLNEGDRDFAIAQRWKDPDRIDVVPHGLAAMFQDPAPHRHRRNGFLFCGSWDPVKGIDDLARAFAIVHRARPDAALTVLGPGVPPGTVLRRFDPDLRKNIQVIERSEEEVVRGQYREHRVLVMCSTYEGFGMVVPEAMSQGAAVIATPVGIAASFVRDGDNGLVVPPRSPQALATAMIRLFDEPDLAAALGDRAAQCVAGMTWGVTARRTLEVYRQALAARRVEERLAST